MNPDMSVFQMLSSFIYIVKGSKIINRASTDWGEAYWSDTKYVKQMIFSRADMKVYFKHRVSKTKWKTIDPFNEWLTHPWRYTSLTLLDAMKYADAINKAYAVLEPSIDVDAIIRNGMARRVPKPPWKSPA